MADTAPTITVSAQADDISITFTVNGSGFTPNNTVHVRVVDDALNTIWFTQSADDNGNLNLQQPIACTLGELHFSANDERPDPNNATGTLWSNTFDIPCPATDSSGTDNSR